MSVEKLLDRASKAYYNGSPVMSDEQFDTLATQYGYEGLGASQSDNTVSHLFKMYSLSKVLDGENYNIYRPLEDWVKTPKLDGAAVQVTYVEGHLAVAATRGDGSRGQDITDKMLLLVPELIQSDSCQVVGEVVVIDKSIENSRNYASGALNLKDIEEFKTRVPNLRFIAYNVQEGGSEAVGTYTGDMLWLKAAGFNIVTRVPENHTYPTDGEVFRLNSNAEFSKLGFTSRFPRGAYARKTSSDVEIKQTELLEVTWQVGGSGKVTPVATFEEVIIDDAKITRATLHNAGFLEDLDLSIGDTLLVTRSGGVIPKILGKL